MTSETGYLLDNRQREAGRRFDALAELFDPWTLGHLDQLGLAAGWRCWEVGAGGPSVPSALAERVGPTGRVLVTDIDTSWLRACVIPPAGRATSGTLPQLPLGGAPSRGVAETPMWLRHEGAPAPCDRTHQTPHADPAGDMTQALTPLSGPDTGPIEVRRHDVARDEPPGDGFDLVHVRLVLVHLPDRAEALRRMAGAVRPGGWLVVEDADPALQPLACPDERGPAEELANRIRRGFRALLAERGVDLAFGRTLPALLRGAGLHDVRAEGFFPLTSPACRELEAATVRQLRGRLVAGGLATEQEIERHLDHLRGEGMDVTTAPLITCWGRRPR
ncbi:methyltransferase domain-containing protein [Streptomyces sp. DASNCL29]|uniref:class I SAM-dependent methyltransferase n=1 Tax=Streptomyces sp. DASNCL29 TaxID=2583819 RepID=UPI001F0F6225|nr:methyltransferase domain-containing protein [Streptomyces sp. DASNCL29]